MTSAFSLWRRRCPSPGSPSRLTLFPPETPLSRFAPPTETTASLLVDSASLPLVKGSTIDYATELIGSAFRIKDNPQSKDAGCGCGVSESAFRSLLVDPASGRIWLGGDSCNELAKCSCPTPVAQAGNSRTFRPFSAQFSEGNASRYLFRLVGLFAHRRGRGALEPRAHRAGPQTGVGYSHLARTERESRCQSIFVATLLSALAASECGLVRSISYSLDSAPCKRVKAFFPTSERANRFRAADAELRETNS